MAKTVDKARDRVSEARPLVEKALQDEELRNHVRDAFWAAREAYARAVRQDGRDRRGPSGPRPTRRSRTTCAVRSRSCARPATGCRGRTTTARGTRSCCSRASGPPSLQPDHRPADPALAEVAVLRLWLRFTYSGPNGPGDTSVSTSGNGFDARPLRGPQSSRARRAAGGAANARRSEPGSSPVSDEMSRRLEQVRAGLGAVAAPGRGSPRRRPATKRTSSSRVPGDRGTGTGR